MLACMMAIVFVWWHGLWLMIAVIPYLIAYLSYRGAIVLAHQYATAVNTVIDLNRFVLYERLRLEIPQNTAQERDLTSNMTKLIQHSTHISVPYTNPPKADGIQ